MNSGRNAIDAIMNNYFHENPGTRSNIAKILLHGDLGGTGNMVILPVDQGFEHGADKSFAMNQNAYDPIYHAELAIEVKLNAYAAPLEMIEIAADKYPGKIPLILKINSSNSLFSSSNEPEQAFTSTTDDALRLGCAAIGLTIYFGSHDHLKMIEKAKDIIRDAKNKGLAVVIWAYPRGGNLKKEDETAIDVISYAAHMSALLGAHIIKIKPPTEHVYDTKTSTLYKDNDIKINSLSDRVSHIKKCCFNGKRLIVFSGGGAKEESNLLEEAKAIKNGGGNGSIVGRNAFQRSKNEAMKLLSKIIDTYKQE